jgi:hypothetical protein
MQYNAMQCNAMQCNAIQCNAMQCNVCTEVRPSVRNEVSQSFLFFFSFFKIQKMTNLVETRFRTQDLSLKWKSECTDGRTYGMKTANLNTMICGIDVRWQNHIFYYGYNVINQLYNVRSTENFSISLYVQEKLKVCPSERRSGAKNTTDETISDI